MGTLRKTMQLKIREILDNTVFTADDFDLSFGDPDANQYLVSIQFCTNKDFIYLLSAEQQSEHIHTYSVHKRPGKIHDTENCFYSSLDAALNDINNWCMEVRDELRASYPTYKDVENLKATISEHLKNYSSSEEFTTAEINNLNEKFRELEKRIADLEGENIITEHQAKEMRTGVEQVIQDLEYYPKETWLKTATNKITKVFTGVAKSPEGRQLLADGARKLLNLD